MNDLVSKVKGIDLAFEGGEGIGFAEPQESEDTLVFSTPKEGQKVGVLALYLKDPKATWSTVQTPGQVKNKISGLRKEILKYNKQARDMLSQGKIFAPIAKVYTKQAKQLEEKIVVMQRSLSSLPKLEKGRNGYIHLLLALSKKLQDHKPTLARIARYQKEVKVVNLEALKKIKAILKTKDGNFYAGVDRCKVCHTTQYNFWKKTRHAKAYATLTKKQKQFDLDCIGCHVVGWQKPGGLYDIQKPQKLANVQCENCHQYGGLHSMTANKKKIHKTGF